MEKEKSRWNRAFSRLKLRNKLILSIYAVLFPTLIACTALLYYIDYRNTMENNTRLYERFAQNTCNEIAYLQADMVDISTYFVINNDILTVLNTTPAEQKQSALLWYERTPVAFLENVLAIKSHLKTVILYPENGLPPFYISRDESVHDTSLTDVRQLELYQNAVAAKGDVLWSSIPAGSGSIYVWNNGAKIVAYREIYDLSKQRRLGFLAITMNAGEYTRICNANLQKENEGIAVFSAAGEEFVRTGEIDEDVLARVHTDEVQQYLQGGGSCHFMSNGCYVFCSSSEETGVQVCYLSPRANWMAETRKTLLLPFALALALLLATIPLSSAISWLTLTSVRRLSEGMQKFREGDFSQHIPVETEDEIGELAKTFNRMVSDLRELVEKNYVIALRERESELNALQAQINPHFLYNALDSLYWQAVGADNEALAENILSLSKMFRLLLSQGHSTITVAQEKELIDCYLQMQKMRFSTKLEYSVEMQPEMLACAMPKLTLQPFVENAVVHGLEKNAQGGHIAVRGRLVEGMLQFEISDDGVGMAQDEADRLLSGGEGEMCPDAHIGHYAIRNIKERLTMRYGTGYVLNISSVPGKGTDVLICIPAQEISDGGKA